MALSQPEERRIVTIVFADLVGFTTLAERMDPEQVKRLIDACFERLVDVVVEFGGKVDKILGDGMLVLFGAPVAHEDDPERAVRAALRMQETLAHYVATSELAGSADIRMRVGINTGEVLVGTLAGTDYTAMGDVVNTASRLQAEAPAGGVLVGEVTHGLTSHTFRYEPAGTLQPRGREQALQAWLALEPTAPPGNRRRRRRDLGIVGRRPELTIAEAALELVRHSGRGVLLHVNGDNGVGKSRYVDEVISRVREHGEASVLEGACVPYGEANVWWPIASALSNYLDLDTGIDIDAARSTALQRAQEMFPSIDAAGTERLVDVFTHLLGYPSPIDRLDALSARNAIHQTVAMVLEARSHRGPMVLSIDDVHWADQVLLDLLEHLVTALSRHSFLLITAMRPGHDVAWPPRSDRGTVLSITLQPLTRLDIEELATALLGDAPRDEQLLTALYDRSGGNPLFLLELVALTEAGGGHRELPDSLRTLIAARLDQLTAEQRQTLENAAVLGTSGAIAGLEKFARELGQVFHPEVLHELDELGLIEVHGRRWEFRSESVRDAAYQTLTKAARAQRHAGVAKAMSSVGQLDDRAHHTAAAAELVQELGAIEGVPTNVVEQAVILLSAAADRALDSGSLRMAVRHASRALELSVGAGTADAQLAHLYTVRAGAYIDQRNFTAAGDDIDALQVLAETLSDVRLQAESFRLRGSLSQVAGRIDDARRELGQAVDLLRDTDEPAQLAHALRVRGFIEMFGGSLVDAEWFFGEADGLYATLGDERGLAYIEQHRAWIAFLSGDLAAARERLTHAAEAHERLGDRNGVGWAFGLLAFVEFFEGHFDRAEALAGTVAQEAELRGDVWAASMMNTLLADLRLWQGKLEEAADLAEKARVRFKKLNDKFGLIQALAPLVRAQVALGRHAAAQRSAEELLTLADTAHNGPAPLMAVAGAAMHRGNANVAAAMAERALAEITAMGGRLYEPMLVLALSYAQLGRTDEALATIESVPPEGDNHPFTHAVAALVYAAVGQPELATGHADAVTHADGATYLDQVFAYVAAAGAAVQMGDTAQAELTAQAAVARAIGVGDVVATALATAMFHAVSGATHPAHDERTPLGDGWVRLVRLLASPTHEPSASSAGE
ncbi:MAG TPA: adenylate/guanylate cyclase domain-containing protein [Ilumatobacteraceae bacterium]|nr:AAA family ATPase [Ilumatobacteraceae bacterium]HQY15139.1 adenylate/guanylate cyclase domain-containing protein [Ilumatobacteraceae bacterium]HRA83581.1 adenylate/guanylate cyclase domain-containing protein [Ilumatobacteraceae bacterium]